MALKETLRKFLLDNFPDASVVAGGKEVLMRCRFCGDSQKNLTDKHLYISLGTEDKPPQFNCFKCGEHGLVTKDMLERLCVCVDDQDLLSDLHDSNVKSTKRVRKNKRSVYNLRWDYICRDELSDAKLAYINRRLGLNLGYDDIIQDKIILNLGDLLKANRISHLTRHINSVLELSESFLGFLSMNNGCVTLKNLRPGKVSKYVDHKYVDYQLFDNGNISRRYYSIPTQVNIIDPTPIKVHIAEGTFDVLSIFYNMCGANRYQNLYINCGDKAYFNVMKMIIKEFGFINCEFHVYIDNNIDPKTLYLNSLGMPIYVYMNDFPGMDDFGVRGDQIRAKLIK